MVLYELREVYFHEISRASDLYVAVLKAEPNCDHELETGYKRDPVKITEADNDSERRKCLKKAMIVLN